MTTKTASRTLGSTRKPEQLDPVDAQDDPGAERDAAGSAAAAKARARIGAPAYADRGRGRSGRGRPPRTATACAVARPRVRASRVGYSDPPKRAAAPPGRPGADPPASDPSPTPRPDVPTRQLEARLRRPGARASWRSGASGGRSRGCARRTRAARRWSFLDGPITANNPMGVHHAWGRTYKDLYQRFHAMLGEDQRYQNGFDCQGLWVEVNVERDLGFTSKRDIEAYGIAEFVTPVQAARADLRRAPDRAVDPARHVDGLERPGRAAPAARPARPRTRRRSRRSRARTARSPTPSRCSSGGSGMPERRRLLLHVQQREQRPHLGLPRRVPPARLAVQGPRHDAVVRRAAGRASRQMEMNEGYQDREDPGLTVRFPLLDRPGRVAARLDDDALDARRQRRGGGRPGPALRPGPPGRRRVLARQGDAQDGARRARSRSLEERRRRRPRRLALRRARSTTCRRSGRRSRATDDATPPTSTVVVRLGRGRRGRGHRHRPHRARAAAPRTSSSARRSGCRSSAPLDEDGHLPRRASAGSPGARRPRRRRADRRATSSATGCFYHLEPYTHRYPHCWRCGTPLALPARRRVVHQHGPGLRPAARDADRRSRSTRACATRSWRSSTRSAGSPTSATSASSTGCATCTTG